MEQVDLVRSIVQRVRVQLLTVRVGGVHRGGENSMDISGAIWNLYPFFES